MGFWGNIFSKLKYKREDIETPRRGFSIAAGIPVYEDSAMQVSAFYRGVTYISTQIAKIPWQVKDAQNKIVAGNIDYLLNVSPNSEMSSMFFRLTMVQNAIISGNAYAEIERDLAGRPVALWPIPSRYVEPYRTLDGKLVYRIISGSPKNVDVYLSPKDIFHVKNFHTKDGISGQGVVAYASEVLGISLGADRMASGLFANAGIPSGVIEVQGTLSDEAFLKIKESWKNNHGGKKSGGVAVLEQGSKFNPITMDPQVLQFLESRKFNVLEVARFLGLPPTKLFDTDAATFNNQENSNLEVATDTLDSWARSFESEADIKLLNGRFGGKRTEFDLYAIFRGDMTTRAAYFQKMMQSASITPNEIRQREGMSPYEDGDRYYVAVNNFFPADRVDEYVDSKVQNTGNSTNMGNNGTSNSTPEERGNAQSTDPQDQQDSEDQISALEKAAIKFLNK